MKALFQLERYFLTKLSVEANDKFVLQEMPETQEVELRFNLGLGENKDDPTKFQIVVGIDDLKAKKGELPYRIALEVVGQFLVDKDYKPEYKPADIRKIVQINGGSMLYSAARELVLTITGRGPWPALQLPTINLNRTVKKTMSEVEKNKS